ncbi:unnamed protein product, partial [Allacma fusca]
CEIILDGCLRATVDPIWPICYWDFCWVHSSSDAQTFGEVPTIYPQMPGDIWLGAKHFSGVVSAFWSVWRLPPCDLECLHWMDRICMR